MSHNINEQRTFFYGEVPWHGIGTELDHPATAKEAIEAARLDYDVQLHPIMTDFKTIEGQYATARSDNHDVLGIVTNKYKIIQNVDAFSFFDSVVGEGQAIYHTAGALGKGERIWILAQLPRDIIVARVDQIKKYLVLTTSHDGKSTLKLYFTPVRVVCQNTLTFSLRDAKEGIAIRHSGNIEDKVQEARRILGLSIKAYDEFNVKTNLLAERQMTVDEANRYFDFIVYGNKIPENPSTNNINRKNQLLYLFEKGRGNDRLAIRHTPWAAYNAVTEYVDHYAPIRNLTKDTSNRLKNIWFGTGAEVKQQAFKRALSICNIN